MKKRLLVAACLSLVLAALVAAGAAAEEEALDITKDCTISTSYTRLKTGMMRDRKFTTKWYCEAVTEPYVQITMPAGVDCYGVYICFADEPKNWLLQSNETGEWITLYEMTDQYTHVYAPLYGAHTIRIVAADTGKYQSMAINEIFLFSKGAVPGWVQRWQPAQRDADLLFLVAHPDDELLFFGGAIPTYAAEQQRKVVVAYMCYSNTTRRSELLNGLWAMGVRNYPVIGGFPDTYTSSAGEAAKNWGRKTALSFVVETVRKYKPKVLVTHDFDGEYGHGAHELTAELAEAAYGQAADAEKFPESAQAYGTWQPLKLYSHLYGENQISLDWDVTLANMDGKTGLELATGAYALHVTQQSTSARMDTTGVKYDNTLFGLVHSEVGADVRKNDFLENVLEHVDTAPATELPAVETMESPVVTYADVLPALNENGFLDAGEFVYENPDTGLWIYISRTLKVTVRRKIDMNAPLRWFEAEIWSDVAAGEIWKSVEYAGGYEGATAKAAKIARQNGVVFGINADYYTYRMSSKTLRKKGIVIRDGMILMDDPYPQKTDYFPNLDTLALFQDGRMAVHTSYDLTAQEYLDMGATDVYSFGPCLVRDGKINPDAEGWATWTNPRCALGMIEPGHYAAVMAEGRLGDSDGITMTHLASLMYTMGCTQALNLDGGQTSALVFMGRQLNAVGEYDGNTSVRPTTEILGIGTSERVLQTADE